MHGIDVINVIYLISSTDRMSEVCISVFKHVPEFYLVGQMRRGGHRLCSTAENICVL